MEKIVRFDNEQFLCDYWYDLDNGSLIREGIDVYYISSNNPNKYIGEIHDIGIPDEKDLDEVAKFEETVVKWLYTQDINYKMGE